MEFSIETKNTAEQFISLWTNFADELPTKKELPDYLKNQFLINNIAQQSKTIIQVFDMMNFKTIYTSTNCLEITGFTPEELNNFGVLYWLSTIPMKQSIFYLKSGQFVNKKIKTLLPTELSFKNQCINLSYKNKAGERKSMISNNTCIEWAGNKQSYQLILWQDMTHLFKTKDFVVRYEIGNEVYNYQSTIEKFKEGDFISKKESEIIFLFKQNLSSKEIAEKLDLSPFTVDNHKKNLISKFQTNSMNSVVEICNFLGL